MNNEKAYVRASLPLIGLHLEDFTEKLLKNSGYEIKTIDKQWTDFEAEKSDKLYYIEVKASTALQYRNLSLIEKSIIRLVTLSKMNAAQPVLFVYSLVSEKEKQKYYKRYSELIIVDLANILYSLKGTELQNELIAVLPFSVEQIEQVPVDDRFYLEWLVGSEPDIDLLHMLDEYQAGRSTAFKFEELCTKILRFIFAEDLTLWSSQQNSNKGLYRFDLLCRIKDHNLKPFWGIMERYFRSKYIVFEFKNYTDKITQSEINTTERYLYEKALRNVAIIIARNGFDDNSKWAAKGCLRENGKLIILVTIDELKEMYKAKRKDSDPSEVLLKKLDDMLSALEK